MLKSFGYIMLFLVLGESLRYLFNVPVAGNILGMALIFLALRMKVITLDLVKPAANKLLKYMVLFFCTLWSWINGSFRSDKGPLGCPGPSGDRWHLPDTYPNRIYPTNT